MRPTLILLFFRFSRDRADFLKFALLLAGGFLFLLVLSGLIASIRGAVFR